MTTKKQSKSGNDIQIDYEKHLGDDRYIGYTLTLEVVQLNFQSAEADEWQGKWKDEDIWVKYTRPGHETIFSENFPDEHKSEAREEVERIVRQFD